MTTRSSFFKRLYASGAVLTLLVATAVMPIMAQTSDGEMLRARFRTPQNNSETENSKIFYQQWVDDKRTRTLPIKIYLPKIGQAPYPVVIFSHGLGGSVEAAPYLAEAWTKAGYICFFVQHPGSDTNIWLAQAAQGKAAIMAAMRQNANPQNLLDRVGDIKFVIDQLTVRNESDALLKGKLDLNKIAMSGHSFGAGTTLAIAGQTYPGGRSSPDSRIKAALYLCPPVNVNRVVQGQTYAKITVPGLLLTGTEDTSPLYETKATDRRIPFDGITAPHQYLVNFIGANHATFGGGRRMQGGTANDEQFHVMIAKVSTEFLDATLKNDAAAWHWLDGSEVKDYLGKSAEFEKK